MICSSCNKDYSESDFHSRGNGKKHKQCKYCKRIAIKKHYEENKADYLVRSKKSNKQLKVKIDEIVNEAKNKPCFDCGRSYPYYVMEFDHVKGNKKANVADLKKYFCVNKILEEIAKCEVVCANCHRERTFSRIKQKNKT